MLDKTQFMKLIMLFCFLLLIGLNWNSGFAFITGFFLILFGFGIFIFDKRRKGNTDDNIINKMFEFYKYENISGGFSPAETVQLNLTNFGIAYCFFYLCLVFFGLIMSWLKLTRKGIQNYKISSKALASKRPVYFIYFVFIFLSLLAIFIRSESKKEFIKPFGWSLLIVLFLFSNSLNLLVDSWSCHKIKESDIVQSFDCEEIKINKIDE